ncbi:FkbM family methyltransferase [Candidatus Neomarinimicrobiota bacterium]
MSAFVFIFSPPYSGSTLLWELMSTSDNISSFVTEGQFLPEVRNRMRFDPWNPNYDLPWETIKNVWLRYWDPTKPLLLEKSPANLIRTHDIVKYFKPLYSVIMVRNPYANCESLMRHYGWDAKESAIFTLKNLRKQIDNVNNLPRCISFTYEELAENTKIICEKIKRFIPEIGELNYHKTFKLQSIDGLVERVITNLNDKNIRNLSRKSFLEINDVFKDDIGALHYWGYKLLEPSTVQDFSYLVEKIKVKLELFKKFNIGRINNLKYYYKLFGYKGIYFLTKRKFIKNQTYTNISIPDIKHPVSLRLLTTDIEVFKRVFKKHTYRCKINDYPRLIIDAGANIGLTSIYFANHYPEAKIIALEPEESNFNLLKINTANYENIIPVKVALWKKNTSLALVPGFGNWGFQTLEKSNINAVDILEMVRGVTIDSIIRKYNLASIDLLKINIVGSEKEVFEDASHWIDYTKTIIIDLHDWVRMGCTNNFQNATKNFDINHHYGDNVYFAERRIDSQ